MVNGRRLVHHLSVALNVLLLSDQAEDVHDVLASFPLGPWRIVHAPLKTTAIRDLVPIHPDVILIDATADPGAAEETTKTLSLAWEIGLPPIIVIVQEETVHRFRYEVGADDFILTGASSGEIAARLDLVIRRSG
ncbi:MAG TPA: hypothetical protein VFS18_03300, partial [Actinomycetota bacterium]|nr:hypothetical protein [Actinomycetota bacterium]